MTDSLGGVRDYVSDDANRVTSRKYRDASTELRLDSSYNDRNDLTGLFRYNDLAGTQLIGKTSFGYDDGRRLVSITHKDGSTNPLIIDSYTYTLDAANRVKTETSTLGPFRSYGYDDDNQLLSDGTNGYSYDKNGNRTIAGYVIDKGNRLKSDGTWNYFYETKATASSRSTSPAARPGPTASTPPTSWSGWKSAPPTAAPCKCGPITSTMYWATASKPRLIPTALVPNPPSPSASPSTKTATPGPT